MIISGTNPAVLFLFAVIPVILILFFVYKMDKKKEPIFLLIQLFGLGIISCFLVLLASSFITKMLPFLGKSTPSTLMNTLIYTFITVAFVEELCKWLMVRVRGYNAKEYDEIYDMLVYSVFVSLGFAFFENILYVFKYDSINTAILRGLVAIPGHACFALFMGYYLTVAKQCSLMNKKQLENKNVLLSIIIPTLLHGIYDFCLMAGYASFIVVFLIFVISLYIISLNKLKEVARMNVPTHNDNKFCNKCGAQVGNERFCKKCGSLIQ